MLRALYTAASGMSAQETNLDNVANNLANSSTTGFREFASYERCAAIICTNSSTTSTFDCSRYPCSIVPSPSLPPGVPCTGSPEAVVARKRLLPVLFSPPGLGNSASCMVPTCWAAVCPAVVTLTVPSRPIVIEAAPVGMVIAGDKGLPSAVTTFPLESTWKAPLRVYAVSPDGRVT